MSLAPNTNASRQPRAHLYRRRLALALIAALTLSTAAQAFDLDSDSPIKVKADNARLDDSRGVATYTGDVIVTQDETRLTADRVVLYRDATGLNRIEAEGQPAHYHQPARDNTGETDARARRIIYDAANSRLTFERDAVIEQGDNLFRGNIIHYDTEQRVVTAEGTSQQTDGDGRVEMVIQPRSNRDRRDGSSQSQ